MLTRREMLQTSLVMGGAAMFGSQLLAAEKTKPQTGVQLYSIRGICKKENLPERFKALKDMGYAGVEFAGYYGCSAEELKKVLDDTGLKACGTHTGYGSIKSDQIEKTIEYNATLGNKYLVVPGGVNGDENAWKEAAEVFSKAAEIAKKAGMYVGYHNHQHEFKDKDPKKFPSGKCAWDIFFSNAAPEVFMQMDIGHCVAADEDPVFWFKKFPHRLRTVHAKEVYGNGYSGVLGEYPEGSKHVDWDAVFPVLENDGLEWYIVESEAHSDRLEDVKGCVDFLKKKGRA